jgi:NADP-dependent aldehyde dehydrogenase
MTEFRSIDARTAPPIGPALAVHGLEDVARLCAAAEAAFDLYRATGGSSARRSSNGSPRKSWPSAIR